MGIEKKKKKAEKLRMESIHKSLIKKKERVECSVYAFQFILSFFDREFKEYVELGIKTAAKLYTS